MLLNPKRITRVFYDTEFYARDETIYFISLGARVLHYTGDDVTQQEDRYVVRPHIDKFFRDVVMADASSSGQHKENAQWIMDNVYPHLKLDDPKTHEAFDVIDLQAKLRTLAPDPAVPVQFWAYVNAYDHVVLRQSFGGIVNSPRHWPYGSCEMSSVLRALDIPKMTDDMVSKYAEGGTAHNALTDAVINANLFEEIRLQLKTGDHGYAQDQVTSALTIMRTGVR